MSKVGQVVFTLRDTPDEPVAIVLTMPDGRESVLRTDDAITRREARVILGAVMNAMRAGLRADQFRHGTILQESARV